mgnify:CR=1 FL=1
MNVSRGIRRLLVAVEPGPNAPVRPIMAGEVNVAALSLMRDKVLTGIITESDIFRDAFVDEARQSGHLQLGVARM